MHRSDHSSPDTIDELTNEYRLSAHNYWATTLTDIEKVKRGYRETIRTAKKAKGQ
ncbi:hypothetical protein [Photorhabdus temperata]|uniref:Uncharacterized protein n=1 Tax=Photorhabdus temperata J3 TaxID=1389415 RepID=U7QRW1_PHOTE|nr:hypothetical protein [Photorhabdus temperata]ERT10714.1 hypothetical protein O185_23325 [Photorhabdus temperata J3]